MAEATNLTFLTSSVDCCDFHRPVLLCLILTMKLNTCSNRPLLPLYHHGENLYILLLRVNINLMPCNQSMFPIGCRSLTGWYKGRPSFTLQPGRIYYLHLCFNDGFAWHIKLFQTLLSPFPFFLSF